MPTVDWDGVNNLRGEKEKLSSLAPFMRPENCLGWVEVEAARGFFIKLSVFEIHFLCIPIKTKISALIVNNM